MAVCVHGEFLHDLVRPQSQSPDNWDESLAIPAKGAQQNQEALKEFREDVKYVSKLLIIAIDKKMTDKKRSK